MPSTFFPHVNLAALKKWAITTAANHHPVRNVSRRGGKPVSKATPKITGCEDVFWAGTKMILITFDPVSLPMGPRVMLAHFPKGRPRLTTQALVGMTDTVSKYKPGRIGAPKIYAFIDYMPNDIGAEVVLLEKVPGENLADIWPKLPPNGQFMVLVKVAELLCCLFNFRGSLMCTDLLGTGTDTRPILPGESRKMSQFPVLLGPAFDQGPLVDMDPVPAQGSTKEYLEALAGRVERVFSYTPKGDPTPENLAARKSPLPNLSTPELTYLDVQRVRDTWERLKTLIPYHTGGFYLPKSLSGKAREVASNTLQSRQFGIKHTDMQMWRFIVEIHPVDAANPEQRITITLTGWEHAHRAPLWSCACLPPWLAPQLGGREIIPADQKAYYRDLLVGRIMNDDRMLRFSWQWFVAFIYGESERWFEACLSTHWHMRDHVEYLLPYLKRYWEQHKPDMPFPLVVGRDYAAPGDTALGAADRPEVSPNPNLMAINEGGNGIGQTLGDEWKAMSTKWTSQIKK